MSGMEEVYDDPNCNPLTSGIYKSMQFIYNEPELVGNPDNNSKELVYVMDYLYGNATIEDTIRYMNYLDKVYYVEYDSVYGLATLSIIGCLYFCCIISFSLMFRKNFKFFLKMFNKKNWFISLSGLCICASYGFFIVGEITVIKCQLKHIVLIFGISLFYYPFLVKLIIFFPRPNKWTEYIKKHNVLCLFYATLTDLVFIILIMLNSPYEIKVVDVENGMNFNECVIESIYHYIYISLFLLLKAIELTLFLYLVYVEWNIRPIKREIRIISICFYINLLFIVLFIIEHLLHIRNLYSNFLLKISINLSLAYINFVIVICTYIQQHIDENKRRSLRIDLHRKKVFQLRERV